ncbi:MAG: N-acetylneuraminate synthase family protein [Methanoregula sp.]
MKTFVIAEIGINHNGDIAIAKKLIDIAKNAGCNAVKFQKRTLEIVYTKELLDSPRESPWGKTQRDQKAGLEFGKKEYDIINAYCKEKKIEWFASAWDVDSQKFLQQFNAKFNKVASAMLTHLPLLEVIAKEKKHTFISTGMSSFTDIDRAVEIFRKNQCPFSLLHCVSTYPSEDNECNLLVMNELRNRYKCDVGYSGHEKGILPSVLAVALGATIIERHITLDKKMYGSDQAASIDEPELRLMMQQIRAVPGILGSGVKEVSDKEMGIAKKLRYFE